MNTSAASRVLVVEDDQKISDLLLIYLRAEGYEATPAYDGHDAVAQIAQAICLAPAVVQIVDRAKHDTRRTQRGCIGYDRFGLAGACLIPIVKSLQGIDGCQCQSCRVQPCTHFTCWRAIFSPSILA